ncbi:MAG: hypothetical protein KA184_02110 [Candidatus Hydrogenedentes bacterium]|nr:hypothetical protein [Candidatus Hydrogenedentota bacterium]
MKRLLDKNLIMVTLVALITVALGASVSDAAGQAKKPKPPRTLPDHTARQTRPIQLGVSGGSLADIANGYCCSGTLGALVQDPMGNQYILSNTHVFAGDSVPGGNGVVSQVGDPVNQPGYVDVSCTDITDDYVGYVADWSPIVPNGISVVDAALAAVIPGAVDPSGAILEIGVISAQPVAAYVNQPVKKSGRTSGLTTGKVAGLDATVSISYEDECAGNDIVSTFEGQILISPGKFLKAGDSGSLLVENVSANPRAVGLLYAGSSRVAIANPIQDVLATFGVTLVGTGSGAKAAEGNGAAAGLAQASRAKAVHAAELMAVPGAVGHAVGLSATGTPVVKVLVERVTRATRAAVPVSVDGVPVQVLEVGHLVAY